MMKAQREIVRIDEDLCDGCGQCVPGCEEGAIKIINGKARLIADNLCDGLGACLGQCPQNAISIITRPADPFDHDAVEQHLSLNQKSIPKQPGTAPGFPNLGCGCPGSAMKTFSPAGQKASLSSNDEEDSALSHWPVKIRLIPPHAPFLKNADLLIAADCACAALPSLHQRLLPEKVIMLGCPKFDEVHDYIRRFVDILKQNQIKSITVLSMEVPCCAGLAHIVRQAIATVRQDIPFEEIKITRQGVTFTEKPADQLFQPLSL
ncbi:ATP-binding protein [Desulfonatronovibrio magnus]|uniref:ATP-binding protein n=1 Tax=Desulfonatronovibrio magnus TaxID=698827 RepID=UPI000AF2003D|nr:4Fe-4S binding protein [Desulfonatronovibrio magnus]